MRLMASSLREVRWFYGDGGAVMADIYYGFAGGLVAMGCPALAYVSASLARSCERKYFFRALYQHMKLHLGMDSDKWTDLAAMARFNRIDREKGRQLIEGGGHA